MPKIKELKLSKEKYKGSDTALNLLKNYKTSKNFTLSSDRKKTKTIGQRFIEVLVEELAARGVKELTVKNLPPHAVLYLQSYKHKKKLNLKIKIE